MNITDWFVGAAYMPPAQPPGYYDIKDKPHGTVKTVPYKPAGNLHFSQLYLAVLRQLQYTGWFVAAAGHFPLIRRGG